jgi:putative restriction endonuclease
VRAYVAVTDKDWYQFLEGRPDLDEVNFWQPGGNRVFGTLKAGEPFLFKLHYPDNAIVGGGFLAHASLVEAGVAWDAFGEKNGAPSYAEMRRRIERYRRAPSDPRASYQIGCIILVEPFFWSRRDWIPAPADFSRNIVQGKTYDLTTPTGSQLWNQVMERLQVGRGGRVAEPDEAVRRRPVEVLQRLGQGAFRILVTDLYERRCAITREKTLPVLQAAHIQPVASGGSHRLSNGLLLRSDVHTLFDRGYLTVTPERRVRVSRRLKADFDNGEHYYQLEGSTLWVPQSPEAQPRRDLLEWHSDTVFRS